MRTLSIGGALGAVALVVGLLGGVAAGQGVVRTDPRAGSPAGVIYQIPLDSGRRDAAPVLPVGSRTGGSGGGATAAGGGGSAGGSGGSGAPGPGGGSAGAGSGSAASGGSTPGAAGQGSAAGGESASTGAPPGGGTPGDPSSIHSENGFGSSSQVPGVSPAAARIGAGVAAAHTAGSTLPSYLLMVLIALAAVAVGLIASRARGEAE